MTFCPSQSLQELFAWYKTMGIDHIYTEEAADLSLHHDPYFKQPKAKNSSSVQIPYHRNVQTKQPFPQRPMPSDDLAKIKQTRSLSSQTHIVEKKAQNALQDIHDLNAFYRCLKQFYIDEIGVKDHFFSHEGNACQRIMIISDAPRRDDYNNKQFFSGKAKELFNRALKAIDLERDHFYFSHIIPHALPNFRSPTQEELSYARPFIEKHIALLKPELILLLGSQTAQFILQSTLPFSTLRKKVHSYCKAHQDIPCIISYNPYYLLQSAVEKRFWWQDLLQIKQKMSVLDR